MRRLSPLASFVLSLSAVLPLSWRVLQRSKAAAPPDFAHDLGVPVRDVKPLGASIPAQARARVAERAGCDAKALDGIQLFTGTLGTGPSERAEDLVLVPLDGPARGGRLVFSAAKGCAHEMGLWGALDFDADPTLRWGVFTEQLRVAGTHETGAGVEAVSLAMEPASEIGARLDELATAEDSESKLTDALLRERMVMRRNGIWLGMSRRGKERPKPEWLAELAKEMEDLAKLAPVLEPVFGPGAEARAQHARDVAATYSEMADTLRADPAADLRELEDSVLPSCGGCHSQPSTGLKWPERAKQRRRELELTGTHLALGFDVAPTLGDHEHVSKELADKVRAGLLLLEAARQ